MVSGPTMAGMQAAARAKGGPGDAFMNATFGKLAQIYAKYSIPFTALEGLNYVFGGQPIANPVTALGQYLYSGEGQGKGQTQTGDGQTKTGDGQADSGETTTKSNPFTMFNPFAQQQREGGIVGLAAGGVFEGRVQGTGDGMADEVAFNVVPQTPADIPNTPDMALLSSDEYVVPADVVSMLGNGSSTAGAQALDQFNQIMRKKAHGTDKQQRELDAGKELSRLV